MIFHLDEFIKGPDTMNYQWLTNLISYFHLFLKDISRTPSARAVWGIVIAFVLVLAIVSSA